MNIDILSLESVVDGATQASIDWNRAICVLAKRDVILGDIIARHPDCTLRSRGNAFETLARAITGQQISVKAADSVWRRLFDRTEISAQAVAGLAVDVLRECGYSARKVEYLHDLARHFSEGLLDESVLRASDDEEVIRQLTRVRGIGRWSAEMFLLFHLQRPDVLPLDDIGLQRAMRLHYPELNGSNLAALKRHAENWRPWRSVATWYLWRSLDPVEVVY